MFQASRYTRWLAIIVLVLLPVAAAPLVGTSVAAVSAVMVVLVVGILFARARGWRPGLRWTVAVAALTLLGGVIGVVSAASGLLAVQGVVPYTERVGFGYAALVLAVIAGAAGLSAAKWSRASAAIIVGAGVAGAVAINLFYINTYYLLAVPPWLTAAVAALMAPPSQAGNAAP
jgi:hypothetical protein